MLAPVIKGMIWSVASELSVGLLQDWELSPTYSSVPQPGSSRNWFRIREEHQEKE